MVQIFFGLIRRNVLERTYLSPYVSFSYFQAQCFGELLSQLYDTGILGNTSHGSTVIPAVKKLKNMTLDD